MDWLLIEQVIKSGRERKKWWIRGRERKLG
jgi:hypothetical protein